jgi:hypothetical protein
MTTQQLQAAPASFPGSMPEYLVYRTLIQLGKQPDVDFTFQSSLMGGRLERGGAVIDFLFSNPPDLAIAVQGVYFHYEMGSEIQARDQIVREQLAGQGITLIFIDENDIMERPRYYVEEALQYRDHSRMVN